MTDSWSFNMQGYAGDKVSHTMWHGYESTQSVHSDQFHVNTDNWPGHSGSGMYRYVPSKSPKRIVYGVASFQRNCNGQFPWQPSENCDLNGAARIRNWMFASICEFIDNPGVC